MMDETVNGGELVSVIIPAYNLGEYIEKSVKSVLSQTYCNIQIIIVDDGSTDDTKNVCEKLKENDKRVTFIRHKENKGQTITRNDGLIAASGYWIMFLDGDDTLDSDSIERLINAAHRNTDVDIVFAGYKTITNNSSTERLASIKPGVYTRRQFTNYLFDEITSDVLTCIGSKIYRGDLVKNRKEWTSEKVTTNYDMAFVIDALLACHKVAYIDESVYNYIQRNDSITYSYREKMYSRVYEARKKIPVLIADCDNFEERNIDFQKDQLRIVLASLNQEVAFHKGYRQFKASLNEIRLSEQFTQMYQCFKSSKADRARSIYVRLVKNNFWIVLFLAHKMILVNRSGM